MRGISLHIGLNRIDPSHYGTDGWLAGAENDASAMQQLAATIGYQTSVLLTASARADAVLATIRDAASQLTAGDMFFITYAGHGAQIPDTSGDEEDKQDETWCTYDRMIMDDELYALWGSFRSEVLIVTISDSCHSGTVSRRVRGIPIVARALEQPVAYAAYNTNRALYDSVKTTATSAAEASHISAGVISLSGCNDRQLSADGPTNGLFTEKLLQAWDQGRFYGDYSALVNAVRRLMPDPNVQTPGYEIFGTASDFPSRRPFMIAGPAKPCADPVEKGHMAYIVTPTQPEEIPMQTQNTPTQTFINNGNWDEVAAALSQQTQGQRGGGDLISQVIAANAKAAQAALSEARAATSNGSRGVDRGGDGFRAYLWGFQLHIGHDDLVSALNATDPNGEFVRFLRIVIPENYRFWIDIVVPFVVAGATMLRGLDQGRGVYINMSWFAPGAFVPTSA